jgi:soluble lytic murein transglycosylase-like protein
MKARGASFPRRDEAVLGTIGRKRLPRAQSCMGQSSRPSPSRYSSLGPRESRWPSKPFVALACLGGLVATIFPAASRADIYQSVGPDGVVSFTNTKAPGAKLYQKTQARPQVFLPADTSPERYTRYDNWIREAAALYQIPEALIRAVIRVESDFDPRAVSPANARGLMQMIPATAERMLVSDVFDPRQNIFGGVRYLRVLANTFNGDLALTVAAYNSGEGAVTRYGGIPPYPETQDYVVKVIGYYRQYRNDSVSR